MLLVRIVGLSRINLVGITHSGFCFLNLHGIIWRFSKTSFDEILSSDGKKLYSYSNLYVGNSASGNRGSHIS